MRHILTILLLLGFVNGYCQKADTSEVYFELNISRVSTIASMSLDSLWFTKTIAIGKKTMLLGFGDYLGTDEYNLVLSQKRADNVKNYLVALGLDEKDITICKGRGGIMRRPVPGELGFYRDRKVQIITERTSKKIAKTEVAKPVPAPPPPKKEKPAPPKPVAKKEEPKPVAPKPQPKPAPKPPVAKPEPPKPVAKTEAPKPPVAKPEPPKPVAKTEAPKPPVAKPEPPKPPVAKPEPPKPPVVVAKAEAPKPPAKAEAPKPAEVKRMPEKDLATLDPAKLVVNEIIPLNNIFFAPGSNAMLRKSQSSLEQLYKFLNDNKNISIEIDGRICCLDPADGTDEPDGLGGNRSEGRAKNIYIFLVSKGIDRNRIKYAGLGNKKPSVYPERTEFDRELNRRAVIKILAK